MSLGGSSGSTDSKFARQGTTTSSSWRDLLPDHLSQLNAGVADRPETSQIAQDYLSGFIPQGFQSGMPYSTDQFAPLLTALNPNGDFTGKSGLENMARTDVTTTDYANQGYDNYLDNVKRVLADVRSGPTATRSGQAQAGFREADVIHRAALGREDQLRANKANDFALQSAATGQLDSIKKGGIAGSTTLMDSWNKMFQSSLPIKNQAVELANQQQSNYNQFLPAAAQLTSPLRGLQTDNLSGRGFQSSNSMSYGVNFCCFIFLEAYNGKLPWFVRACRDEFAPENTARRNGYIRMSKWLVPLMQRSKVARFFVNKTMIQPLTKWGGFHKNVEGYERGFLFKPFVLIWFKLWEIYGYSYKDN